VLIFVTKTVSNYATRAREANGRWPSAISYSWN